MTAIANSAALFAGTVGGLVTGSALAFLIWTLT